LNWGWGWRATQAVQEVEEIKVVVVEEIRTLPHK